jgi:hypothetical protein
MATEARKTPCATCPYRKNVASGIWHEDEYDKLPTYDGDIPEQVMQGGMAAFHCHTEPDNLCAGWVGHREHPTDLLAVRLGLSSGSMDPSVAEYITEVPLFSSGTEAAEHGKREILSPSVRAQSNINKILKQREL